MRPSLKIDPKMEISTESTISKIFSSNELLVATCFLGMPPEVLEEFLSRRAIFNAIQKNTFMKHFKPRIVEKIMDSMCHMEYPEDCSITTAKMMGKYMIMVEEGKFEVQEEGKIDAYIGTTGKLYGMEEFLMSTRRIVSTKALTKCRVWFLERKAFKTIMRNNSGQDMKNLEILKNFSWFKNVDDKLLSEIADAIVLEYFGTYQVLKPKDDTLYIISNGSVKIIQKKSNSDDDENVLRVLNRGDHFEGYTVSSFIMVAFYPGVELLTFDMEYLKQILGKSEYFRQNIYIEAPHENTDEEDQEDCANIELKDLNILGTLGRGNFGRVDLVSYSKNPEKQFALKVIGKHRTVQILQQSNVISERKILLNCKHPFIVRLYKTFRDDKYVYMLFEACLGGQVWEVMSKNGCFPNGTARFISACALEALDYLHQKDIVYRDLKPDNMVLDQYGYVKLVDFGLSKHLGFTDRTWSFCGTPCGIAPEIILNISHDRAVDLWALGLLVYELLCGCTAFAEKNPMKAYGQIMAGIEKVEIPYQVNLPARDLIKKLCKQEPSERIGYQRIDDIREHSWFKGFDWKGLTSRTVKPPKCLIPNLKDPTDTSNMNFIEIDLSKTPPKEETNWDQVFE